MKKELHQTPANEEILNLNEGHLACVLALDVSGSMQNAGKLQALIDGIEAFKRASAKDPLTLKRVDVSVITFGGENEVKVIQDWIPLQSFLEQPPLSLVASGTTPMGAAIKRSLALTRERSALYRSLGTPSFTPLVMMITDGLASDPGSLSEAVKELREREDLGRVRFFACGVGLENTDMEALSSISKRVIQCEEGALSHLFDWMTASISTISHSRVGDAVQLPPLPQGLTVVPSDW